MYELQDVNFFTPNVSRRRGRGKSLSPLENGAGRRWRIGAAPSIVHPKPAAARRRKFRPRAAVYCQWSERT